MVNKSAGAFLASFTGSLHGHGKRAWI